MDRPTVTFVWREDRVWSKPRQFGRWQRVMQRVRRRVGLFHNLRDEQTQQMVMLAQALRETFPKLDFSVAGLGCPGGLPDWIADSRTLTINEPIERAWCEQYAKSHVVIGVHGSNMLLPSAHSGAVIELMPPERYGNVLQDILRIHADSREAVFHCRVVPISIHPQELTNMVISLLRDHRGMVLTMGREFCRHTKESVNPHGTSANTLS